MSTIPLSYKLGAGLLVVVALLFIGEYHGRGVGDAKCNVERLANAKAANVELNRQIKRANDYAKQLTDANAIIATLNARIDAAASAPVHHVVCHPVAGSGGNVPTAPTEAGPAGSGPGAAGNVRGSDFDPSIDERKLHYAFAKYYAACLDALNRWPN
jgi:hypothetical protein